MEKLELKGLDQEIYFEQLSNGLKVYVLPYKYKSNYFVNYYTKFGSVNLEFSNNEGENIVVPAGVAHFLEHKMFEQENGETPFEFYSKTGTMCNASTSYKSTKYILYGNTNFKENFDYLISYINSPYFTDENVEKEKGIIIEEIKMYDDNPEWMLNEELQQAVFEVHPFRIDIAGTEKTVNAITKEDLKICYDTFYNPNNMGIVVGGDVDPDDVIDVIKNNKSLNNRKEKPNVSLKKYLEKEEVFEKHKEIITELVKISKLGIGIKQKIPTDNIYEYNLYVGMILSILFGSSSEFREQMLKNKKMTSLVFERTIIDDILAIEFWIQSSESDYIIKELIKYFKTKEINETDFNRYKKVWIASEVMMADNIEVTVNNIIDDMIDYDEVIYDKIDRIRNMNYQRLLEVKESLNIDNYASVVLKPSK